MPGKGVQGGPHGTGGTGKGGMRAPGATVLRKGGSQESTRSRKGGSQGGEIRDGRQWRFWGPPVLKKGVLGLGKGRNGDPGTPRVEEKRRRLGEAGCLGQG